MLYGIDMITDRLTLTKAFEQAGIAREGAEHVADVIFDAIRDNVATKADVQAAENSLRADVQAVESKLRSETQTVETQPAFRDSNG
jgi:hypothetical protein